MTEDLTARLDRAITEARAVIWRAHYDGDYQRIRSDLDRYAALVALRARYEEREVDLTCEEPSPACCSAHERMVEIKDEAERLLGEAG